MDEDFTQLPTYPNCFVCGHENKRGLQVPFSTDGNMVRARFSAEPGFLGYAHAIHGGILSTLLDEALIWACYVKTDRFGVTAEITVRYLKPLIVYTPCVVQGRMVEDKAKIWLAEAEILDQEGHAYARAKGKIIPLNEKQNKTFIEALERPI